MLDGQGWCRAICCCSVYMRSSGTCVVPSQFQRQSPPASNKRWVLWIPIFQALHTEWAGPVRTQKKNRPLTGRYTLGDRAISTTQNRCGLLNALGGLTFYRLLNTEQKIFPRKGLTPVINLQELRSHTISIGVNGRNFWPHAYCMPCAGALARQISTDSRQILDMSRHARQTRQVCQSTCIDRDIDKLDKRSTVTMC